MTTLRDVPYLLELLDDPAEMVQEAVVRALAAFSVDLDHALDRLRPTPSVEQRKAVHALVARRRGLWVRTAWPACFSVSSPWARLEGACAVLSGYEGGVGQAGRLRGLLDGLVRDFLQGPGPWDAVQLAHYLFVDQDIRGDHAGYYHPCNSDLVSVIGRKRGTPVSMGCLYILVAQRLRFLVEGSHWPGHFYVRAQVGGITYMVDAYHGGACTEIGSFLGMQGPSREAAARVIEEKASAEAITVRLLHNLILAHQQQEEWECADEITGLLRHLRGIMRRGQAR